MRSRKNMKYRIEIDIVKLLDVEKIHQFLTKTANFGKKFYQWTLTRQDYEVPVVKIKAVAISRDVEIELNWAIPCNHNPSHKFNSYKEPDGTLKTYNFPRDWVLPEAMDECMVLYPRKYTCDPPLEQPYINVFELNDFLEVTDIQRF